MHDDEGHAATVRCEHCLGLGRTDEAHRKAKDQRRFRCSGVKHLQQIEQRRRCITDDHYAALQVRSPQFERGGGSGVTQLARQLGNAVIAQGADDLVIRWQPGAGHAFGDHPRITQDRCTGGQSIAPGLARAFRKLQAVNRIDHAAGVNHPHREFFQIGRDSLEVGLGANDREGVAIDLLTVADVIKHQGGSVSGRRARRRPLQ
ncbi:hypothetical protein D3C84_463780 [compost metagenome]